MAKYLLSEKTAKGLRALLDRQAPDNAPVETRRGRSVSSEVDAFAHPFEVRWSSVVEDWIIWLHPDSFLYNGEYVDPSEDMEPAENGYPEGWYKIGTDGESGSVWLNVTFEDGEASFEISLTQETEFGAKSIKIADVDRDEETGVVKVMQIVMGLLKFGEIDDGCFAIKADGSFANQFVRVGSSFYAVPDDDKLSKVGECLVSGAEETYLGIVVKQNGPATLGGDATVSVESYKTDDAAEFIHKTQEKEASMIPLYKFNLKGVVLCDFRNCPHAQEFEFIEMSEEVYE